MTQEVAVVQHFGFKLPVKTEEEEELRNQMDLKTLIS